MPVLNTNTAKIENKILDVSGLVRKTDYNTEMSDTQLQYFTTDYNKVMGEIADIKFKQANLVTNGDLNTVSRCATKKWKI